MTLAVAAAAVTVFTSPGAGEALEINRAFSRVWSRLWTAHLVHYSGSHLFWNLAILLPAGAWAEQLAPFRTRLFYLLTPPIIGLALLALDRDLTHYAGLSGLATGLLALLAWIRLGRLEPGTRWFWQTVLALIAVKIGWEIFDRRALLATGEIDPIQAVPLAHAVGVFCAAVIYLMPWPRDRTVPA